MEKFKGMLLFASVSKETAVAASLVNVVGGMQVGWPMNQYIDLILRDVYNNPQN